MGAAATSPTSPTSRATIATNRRCISISPASWAASPGSRSGATPALSYLELGCGQGFGALMLAACNPSLAGHRHRLQSGAYRGGARIRPSPPASATPALSRPTWRPSPTNLPPPRFRQPMSRRCMGCGAGSPTRFAPGSSACFATKCGRAASRYVSYNALPAWQGALGMQRLLARGRRAHRRAQRPPGAARARAGARPRRRQGAPPERDPFVGGLLEHAQRAQPAYLAHEYMNAAWRPCFHADVAAALAEAKLDWVASAQLLENFSPLMLSDEVRAVPAGSTTRSCASSSRICACRAACARTSSCAAPAG